jgi:LCP family protein required for cell wall assembly
VEPTPTVPPGIQLRLASTDSLRPAPAQPVRRFLVTVGILGLTLALILGCGVWFLTDRYTSEIVRIKDVFAAVDPETRPAPATPADAAPEEPVTFLLVGSDTRGHPAEGEDPDGRADAIMLARVSADRTGAQLVSIPRDSWVPIPGHGTSKINASYAWGGPALLIQTVEQLTQVRIDHYVAIDFEGIAEVTDHLGGVDVLVAETTQNGPYVFPAGNNHIVGEQARWYLGQRYGLPDGDFDRVRRQQQYLRAVFEQLVTTDTLRDPGKLDAALLSLTRAVSIDDTLDASDLLELVYSLRDMRPGDVEFFTAPVLGTGREGPASVVYLDNVAGDRMWSYLRSDSLGANAVEFSAEALPSVPR